ncbi:MAG: DUF4249 domain-containing protein [Cyclobacteriaceae bacterium]
MKKLLIPFAIAISIYSCDDVVDIPLKDAEPIMTVDAWLNHTSDTQRIVLTYTRPYFDNTAPTPVLNAEVAIGVLDNNSLVDTLYFTDENADGVYEWIPPSGEKFGEIGQSYALQIEALGNTYNAFSTMNDVPPVDSITFEYNEKDAFITEDWYYGEFWSRDLDGLGDTYWIKAYKNDTLLSEPEQMNLAFDASFSFGYENDSLPFIQPIRTAVNPFDDAPDQPSPYEIGDRLKVEIYAITNEAWFFLTRVRDETVRNPGFAQLFANPLSNVPTNIISDDEEVEVVGFFSVASVSSLEVTMSEDNIVDRIPD